MLRNPSSEELGNLLIQNQIIMTEQNNGLSVLANACYVIVEAGRRTCMKSLYVPCRIFTSCIITGNLLTIVSLQSF